jgi:hypothetical protein
MLRFIRTLLFGGALTLSLLRASATTTVSLTDVVVYGADSSGNSAFWDIWETRPGNNFNIWIQNSSSTFLNGPSDALAQPNISLSLGTTSFKMYAAPGIDMPYFGINLLFDGSSSASISAFAPMLTSSGDPHIFSANSSSSTGSPLGTFDFHAAGTLSFISGDRLVTLTDFFWANQATYDLDLTGQTTTTPDGLKDYIGGMTFTVTQVPEPRCSLYALGLLAIVMVCRRKPRVA